MQGNRYGGFRGVAVFMGEEEWPKCPLTLARLKGEQCIQYLRVPSSNSGELTFMYMYTADFPSHMHLMFDTCIFT